MFENMAGEGEARIGKILVGSGFLLAQAYMVANMYLNGITQVWYYLAICALVVCWFMAWADANVPRWLIGTAGGITFLVGTLLAYHLFLFFLQMPGTFGTFTLAIAAIGVLLIHSSIGYSALRDSGSAVANVVTTLLIFAIIGYVAYYATTVGMNNYHQIAAYTLLLFGLLFSSDVPGNKIAFGLIGVQIALCVLAFGFAAFMDKGGYVLLTCFTASVGSVFAFIFIYSARINTRYGPDEGIGWVASKIYSIVCLVFAVAPFIPMFTTPISI